MSNVCENTIKPDSKVKLYGARDHMDQGQHYMKHISAMTSEGLHSKADIAKELAHRDIELLVCRAVVMANVRGQFSVPKRMINWALYSTLFATGSTTAHKMCAEDLGIDPDGVTASLEVMLNHIGK